MTRNNSLFRSRRRSSAQRTRNKFRARSRRLLLESLEDRSLLAAIAPPSGIVSWWTGDNTADDLIGSNDGTLLNGTAYSAGRVAAGFDFDGSDDSVQAPTTGLPTGSADRTIELWARIDVFVPGEETFFASYGLPGSSNQAYALGTNSSGDLFASTWGSAIAGGTLATDTWYHIAATNQGTSFKLYLNGAEVANGSMPVATPAGSTFWLGRQTNTVLGDSRRLNGMVDEVSVYDRALTSTEILDIYNAGADGKIKSTGAFVANFPSVVEGPASTTTTVTFTIQRGGTLSGAATVDWATADNTAIAGVDYVATSGQFIFLDGESLKTVQVTVNGDNTAELNETFRLVLSTPTIGYTVANGTATIINDDVPVSDISGSIFNDANSNGIWEPLLGEVGAANQVVYIDANTNGIFDPGEINVLTSGTGTYTLPDLPNGPYNVRLALDPVTDQTVPTANSGPNLFASLPNIVDHVFDATTGIDYASTSSGNIERFDVRTGRLLTPFKVGVSLGGLDITPDGQFLYVAEQQPGTTQSLIRKVNAQTGAVTNLGFNRVGAESGSFDVTILNNGKAFFTTLQAGGVRVNLREITLSTDAIAIRTGLVGAADIAPFTRLNRNADRTAVVFTEPDVAGNVFFYKTATDSFTARLALNSSLALAPAAISRDGNRAAVATTAGVRIINTTLAAPAIVQTVNPAQRGGLVYDPFRDVLYVGNDASDNLTAFSYTAADVYTPVFNIPIGENVTGSARYFQLNIAPDGKLLTLGTATNIRSYPLYGQTSRIVNITGSDVLSIDFGVHTFSNVVATGTRDYYVMSNAATTLTVTAANGVIPNDRDPNLTQSLTARLVAQATKGFVSLSPNGSFVYITSAAMDVKDTFDYVINDGLVDSAPITATIARVSNKGSSISGREFIDANWNGVYEPGLGDTPIADEQVYLDLNNSGFWDPASEPSLQTFPDGTYNFSGIAAGTYTVRAATPATMQPTWPIAPVGFGLLLPIAGVKDFVLDNQDEVLYVATAAGTILRYSLLTNQYLAPITLPGVPSAMVMDVGGYNLYVLDAQEVNDTSFIYRVNVFTGLVSTISFATPGAETAPVSISIVGFGRGFVSTGRTGAGFNPLHELTLSGDPVNPTVTVSDRVVPVGSGPGGTLMPGTLIKGGLNADLAYFQESGSAGHIFFYDRDLNQFIDGPYTQGSPAGTQRDTGYVGGSGGFIVTNQFGPSLFDSNYQVKEVFPNTFNAGAALNDYEPILYAADGGPDVIIGYNTNTFKEIFRINVGEDLASSPLKKMVLDETYFTRMLVLATPSGLRLFDTDLPGFHTVVVGEDQAATDVQFGQRVIYDDLTVSIPGGRMSEDQGPGALTGILTRRGPDLSQDVFVQLASSDPSRVHVPVAVLIPAGQATTTFPIDAVDNTVLDATPNIRISAFASGVGFSEDFVTVSDQEALAVTIAAATIPEVGGTTTGTVTRTNTDTASPLVVALASSDTSEATVPATVTIPANQQSVTFTITAVDDAIFDGTRSVVISAASPGYVSMNASVGVVSDLDSYRNILVGTAATAPNSRLRTYSPAGALLSDATIPPGTGGDQPARDLVVNAAANVEIYNGTNDPVLSTLDPRRGTFTHRTTAGWSTFTSATFSSFGGIASLGNYLFLTDMATGSGDDLLRGLIRYNITDYSSTRFATTRDFIDVAAGNDGLIYGMEFTPLPLPALPTPPWNVHVYDPNTMAFIRTVALASPSLPLGIAVNAQGLIYAVTGNNLIYEFAANGVLLRTLSTGGTDLNDLDISPAGQLIAGGATGSVVVMDDPGHDLPISFTVGNTQAFVAFGNLNRADGLTLSVAPTTFSEAGGPAASAATVTRPSLADLSVSLVVTLASSDPTEADVQQTVTIPAFQATATFNIAAIDDDLGDFDQSVTLTALAPGQIGASANLTVLDDEINYFTVSIAPSSMPENGGTATGTVTRFVLDNSAPIIVTLTSNDASEATVVATVTILANQNSATFPITAVDDVIRDATQNPVITASAAGMSSGSASIAVTDNEIDTIGLAIVPGSISESGGTATGTVTRFVGNNLSPLVVNLSSNDATEATVSATVTIPAGQNSATFTVTGVNDALRDFNQPVIVTATASGVAATTANVTVTDDELDILAFTFPTTFMMENGGSILVTVIRTVFDNTAPQVVNLLSSDTTEATVPATVTILGGDNSATFTVTAVDDAIAVGDGPQTVTITGSAASFTPATRDITVGDNERPYQNQRNVLDVDVSGQVVPLDSLKVVNLLNGIGAGPATTVMASYSGPPIFPDTNGDNFITANDVLNVINFLNLPIAPGGEGEGEAPAIFSPAVLAAPRVVSVTAQSESASLQQPRSNSVADAAVLAIVGEDGPYTALEDAPRGKHRPAEWDELVSDLASHFVKRRRD